MSVENPFVGKVEVSYHACQRWEERASGSMEESLARAIPFGGQRGEDILLIDGNIVFACATDDGICTVKTVLTRDQAVVNMQDGLGWRICKNSEKPVPIKESLVLKENYAGGLVATTEPLANDYCRSVRGRKPQYSEVSALFDMWHDGLKEIASASGPLSHIAQRLLSLRKMLAKQVRHSETMRDDRDALAMAVKAVVTPEQLEEIYRLRDENRSCRC